MINLCRKLSGLKRHNCVLEISKVIYKHTQLLFTSLTIPSVIDILRTSTNQARMYHFPSSKRDVNSHIHSVPKMREDVAKSQVLNQRTNSPCFKDSVVRNIDSQVSYVYIQRIHVIVYPSNVISGLV